MMIKMRRDASRQAEIEVRRTGLYVMTDDERAAVRAGLARADRGEFVPNELVAEADMAQFVSFSQHPTDPNTLLGGAQGNGSPATNQATTNPAGAMFWAATAATTPSIPMFP